MPMKTCNGCGKKEHCTETSPLRSVPPCLILQLQPRFDMQSTAKLLNDIELPLDGIEIHGKQYQLDGVVVHSGDLSVSTYIVMNMADNVCYSFCEGHYTAFTLRHREWFWCDDNKVYRSTPDEVASSERRGGQPYLLFFKGVDT